MSAFKPPKGGRLHKKNDAWVKAAKYGFRSPNRVWDEYWHRFNTIAIPLMDEDAYFADALDCASRASHREHLEQLLSDRFDERRRDLEALLPKVALDSYLSRGKKPLSEAASSAALKAGQTGSLDSFLQVLCGLLYGWEGGDDAGELPRELCASEATAATLAGDKGGEYPEDYSDYGGEGPFEYENKEVYSPGLWSELQTAAEDAYSDSRRFRNASECGDTADGSQSQRQLLRPIQPPSTDEGDIPTERQGQDGGNPTVDQQPAASNTHNAPSERTASEAPEATHTTLSQTPPLLVHMNENSGDPRLAGSRSASRHKALSVCPHTQETRPGLAATLVKDELLSGSLPMIPKLVRKRGHDECGIDARNDGSRRSLKRRDTSDESSWHSRPPGG